jgi:hypothetical protein
MPLRKKAHEKNLTSKSQSGLGNMAQLRLWARCDFYRRGKVKKLSHVQESPVGVGFCLMAGLSSITSHTKLIKIPCRSSKVVD